MTPAQAVFEAGLPRGEKGDLIPGHTTWEMLGPKARARYERMADAGRFQAEEKLRAIYDMVDVADWQSYGKYPEQFGPFCGRIINIVGIDDLSCT